MNNLLNLGSNEEQLEKLTKNIWMTISALFLIDCLSSLGLFNLFDLFSTAFILHFWYIFLIVQINSFWLFLKSLHMFGLTVLFQDFLLIWNSLWCSTFIFNHDKIRRNLYWILKRLIIEKWWCEWELVKIQSFNEILILIEHFFEINALSLSIFLLLYIA